MRENEPEGFEWREALEEHMDNRYAGIQMSARRRGAKTNGEENAATICKAYLEQRWKRITGENTFTLHEKTYRKGRLPS